MLIAAIILLILLAVALATGVSLYNGLVQKRISCDSEWADIAVQLKRRLDLIPNLVETVKGYATHEKETLERVINARNSALTAKTPDDQIQAAQTMTGALRQVFALAESYPLLQANQNFLQLQGELGNTENIISGSRTQYNETVKVYNTAVQQFPGNIIAGFGGFQTRKFFELSAEEQLESQKAPKVTF
jgi:LemA protein